MNTHQLINGLVTITLIEMMVAIGLGVTLDDVIRAVRHWPRLVRVLAANYLAVPAAALLIGGFTDSQGMAIGFFIVAVFPGSSYGPPFTSYSRGDLSLSVGLMVVLAVSSVFVGPVILRCLLYFSNLNTSMSIELPRIIGTLTLTQLLPLAAGMFVRGRTPRLAARLRNPAEILSKVLNAALIGCILITRSQHGSPFQITTFFAMLLLLVGSLVSGYVLGGPGHESRKTVALTTSLRNVGVCIMVASANFADAVALDAVVGFAIVEITGSLLLALWWGRHDR